MVDSRFFTNRGPFSLEHIARITGAKLANPAEASRLVSDVAPLDRASAQEISFLDNSKYVDVFAGSQAGACILRERDAERAPAGMALLFSDEPYRCYALTAQQFYPAVHGSGDISPQAHIHPHAKLGKGVTVGIGAVIEAGVVIGDNAVISPYAHIGQGVTIGKDTSIGSHSTVTHALIGERVVIHRGVHIGQDGFGFALGREGHIKVPQLGRVVIEDDVEIGSGTCIDRGTGPDTFIGAGTKIDNLVQIGHNVQIGKHVVVVAQVGIAGSTKIGDGVLLGGQVGIAGHLKIGPGVRIAAKSGVINDLPAGASFGGYPAVPVKDWHRQTVLLSKMIKKQKATGNE